MICGTTRPQSRRRSSRGTWDRSSSPQIAALHNSPHRCNVTNVFTSLRRSHRRRHLAASSQRRRRGDACSRRRRRIRIFATARQLNAASSQRCHRIVASPRHRGAVVTSLRPGVVVALQRRHIAASVAFVVARVVSTPSSHRRVITTPSSSSQWRVVTTPSPQRRQRLRNAVVARRVVVDTVLALRCRFTQCVIALLVYVVFSVVLATYILCHSTPVPLTMNPPQLPGA